jgi:hypothetical protein
MPLPELITEVANQIPAGRLVLGVTAAAMLLQLRALVLTYRSASSRRALIWQIASAAGVVVATSLDLLAVHAARSTMLAGFVMTDPAEKASAISAGIGGQLNGIALLASSSLWMWPIGLFGLKKVLEARRPSAGPGFYGPLFLIALGLTSVAVGALLWTTHLVKEFAALAGVAPEDKGARLIGALDIASPALRRFAQVSRWTVPALTVLALALVLARLRRSAPRDDPPPAVPGRRAAVVTSALALLLAATLLIAISPLRRENQLPWPPGRLVGEILMTVVPPTPDLEGPDPLERAPVVQVFTDQLAIDGWSRPLDEIGGILQTLRMNFQLLHPGERFAGQLVLVADRALSMQRLTSVLWVAHRGGYDAPMFAFTREETIVRPMMGPLRRVLSSSARISLSDAFDRAAAGGAEPSSNSAVLSPADFPRYDAFARRLVQLRRAGTDVALDLGKDPEGEDEPARP